MKALYFFLLMLFSLVASSQKTFDDGWKDGFESAMMDYNRTNYIVPISPIVLSTEVETYRAGFRKGYEKGIEKLDIDNPLYSWQDSYYLMKHFEMHNVTYGLTFDDGWEKGYKDAMADAGKEVLVIPISPITTSRESTNYRLGYKSGYNKAINELDVELINNINEINNFTHFEMNEIGDFADGWEQGFKDAMEDQDKAMFIVPISPIVMAGESDTYRSGYRRGYEKAFEGVDYQNISGSTMSLGAKIKLNHKILDKDLTFNDGWEQGYKEAMRDYNKSVFIIPISPIVMAGELDTYKSGFRKGYDKGVSEMKDENPNLSNNEFFDADRRLIYEVETDNGDLTFDDGWEKGYKDAMEDGDETIFIVPISPIVMSNELDTFNAGYRRGYNRGVKDLED